MNRLGFRFLLAGFALGFGLPAVLQLSAAPGTGAVESTLADGDSADGDSADGDSADGDSAEGAPHWSFRPVETRTPPTVRNAAWARGALDRFVLRKLEDNGLTPSPEADRPTLIRRLRLDLIGLPPTPGEVHDFVSDVRPGAYERVVDRLLASPHFGERWGRHWLDVARYADSDGYENDKPRPFAYRYRDWVVGAFNDDLSFDRFTVEQLAGDLLPQPTLAQLTAAGFHRNSLTHTGSDNGDEEFRVIGTKDRLSTTGTAWLGLTVRCAECHSHKFDPLTHEDYYSLYAVFNNLDDRNVEVGKEKVRTVQAARRDSFIHVGGNYLRLGPPVGPRTPGFLPKWKPRGQTIDRLDLARWILDPTHPLTTRVAVNRLWQHLFAFGIVRTPDNFGIQGERPTHPELLDWLAAELPRGGWSRKALLRTLVTSATYRQASVVRPELVEADPENLLLGRQHRFRVEAEVIRDLALAVSGILDRSIGGPRVQPPLPTGLKDFGELKSERFMESAGNQRRRGLYVNVQRTFVFPSFAAFDGPAGNDPCPLRGRSTTPMQALTLLNDPVFVECTRRLGERLFEAASRPAPRTLQDQVAVDDPVELDDQLMLGRAFKLCLGRAPDAAERAILLRQFVAQRAYFDGHPEEARRFIGLESATEKKASVDDAKTSGNETPAADLGERAAWVDVAGTLLNLEEFITRP